MKRLLNLFFARLQRRIAEQNQVDKTCYIHPTAYVSGSYINGDVHINEGCKIYQSRIQGSVEVGSYSSIWGPGTSIISHLHPVKIGKFCSIARYVSIQESNHKTDTLSSYHINGNILGLNIKEDIASKGAISIGHDVWIGAQVIILTGIKIGNGAVIGAGTVVTKDIPPYAIAVGNPARIIKYRFSPEIIKQIEGLNWWDWELNKIKNNKLLFRQEIADSSKLDELLHLL